jgi:hypothetical protein
MTIAYTLLGLLIIVVSILGVWLVPLYIGLLITKNKWSETDSLERVSCWALGLLILCWGSVALLGSYHLGLYIQSIN